MKPIELAIMNLAFHKLKPRDEFIDGFIPWQELWRGMVHRWEFCTPFNHFDSSFIVKFLGTFNTMKFRINGHFVGRQFIVDWIDIITWDESEKVLADFRKIDNQTVLHKTSGFELDLEEVLDLEEARPGTLGFSTGV